MYSLYQCGDDDDQMFGDDDDGDQMFGDDDDDQMLYVDDDDDGYCDDHLDRMMGHPEHRLEHLEHQYHDDHVDHDHGHGDHENEFVSLDTRLPLQHKRRRSKQLR